MNTINANPAEISKFTSLAAQWWDPDGPCRPLHQLNPLRLEFIQRYATLQGQKVLDVGCGGGILTEALAKAQAQATGIDMSAAIVQVAKLHALESELSIHYQEIPVETLANEQPKSFHVVTCMEMLEHVPDPQSIVQACAQLVCPGGYVFFSTLNRNLTSYLQAIIGAEYILGLLPRGTHQYQHFIQPAELAKWLRHANLQLVDMVGLTYHPVTQKFQLTNNVEVNYLVCAQSYLT